MSQQHETVSQMRRLVNLTSEGGRYQIGARVIGTDGRHGSDWRVCVIGRRGRRLRLIGAANRDKEAEQVGRDADAKVHEGAGEDGGHEARGVMSSRSMRAPMSSDPLFFTLFRGIREASDR